MSSSAILTILPARPRDLGAVSVGRVLPTPRHRFLGPFAFLDHMTSPTPSAPMPPTALAVPPHPHLHLATVTYLFTGEIVHRDSLGSHQHIVPGDINWMSAGTGIVHSERGLPVPLHGLQIWVALPRAHEDTAPSFQHHPAATLPQVAENGIQLRILAGSAYGLTSPVPTVSPLFYVDVSMPAHTQLPIPADFAERGLYLIDGSITVDDQPIEPRQLVVFAEKATPAILANSPSRLVLLGGEPLDGPRYIWWNFVSSSKERIIEAAQAWRDGRFPLVPGDEHESVPAPDGPHFTP